jgi:serine/threonine protein kinase
MVNAIRKVPSHYIYRPPYIAGNMVDLLNLIRTKPLKLPPYPKINDTLYDVIKKMLIPDPKRRISWQ